MNRVRTALFLVLLLQRLVRDTCVLETLLQFRDLAFEGTHLRRVDTL